VIFNNKEAYEYALSKSKEFLKGRYLEIKESQGERGTMTKEQISKYFKLIINE
jgi:hypothetical protein